MAKTKLKEPVKVRTKRLADGSESYYLDIYHDGKRHYEFLKLYKLPEINAKVKEQNRATREAVETIKSQRIIELTRNKAGLKKIPIRSKMLLLDWIDTYINMQEQKGARGMKLLRSTKLLLSQYPNVKKVRMMDVNKKFAKDFTHWVHFKYVSRLGRPLTPKSAADYIGYLSSALNTAVRAEVIAENPFLLLSPEERIKVPESARQFLTVDELKLAIGTDCPREDVKQAFLFACYCGLRLSDIYGLHWKDLSKDGEQWRASVIMQKTTTPIFLPLSSQAMRWLPERAEAKDDDKVFSTLPAEPNINKVITKWMKAAGITKHITFHCSRHTFATLMLTLGADLYTTSKLLGHSKVTTTQIYAKIVDSKKVEAVNLVDKVFD